MKILISSDAFYPPSVSGLAYFAHRLAVSLSERGHTVSVIAPSPKFKNTISKVGDVTVYGVKSFGLPMKNGVRISPESIVSSRVRKIIKEVNPDVIHTQSHYMIGKAVVSAAKKYGIPIVGSNHFMPENLVHYFHLPKFAERGLVKYGWREFVKVYKEVDFVSTPTTKAASLTKGEGLHRKIFPISCGIDMNRFNPNNKGGYLRKLYNIPSNAKILLSVSRLDKEKNIDVVIRAMPLLLKKSNVHLVIGGDGNLAGKLKSLVNDLEISDKVTFTGFVPDHDLPNLYATADIFIAPGTAELQCIAALEAIATGLPLVAANAVALPELVKEGKNGFLFTSGSHTSLSKAIVKILSDKNLEKRMHKESLKLAAKHDINFVISEFEKLYIKAFALKAVKKNALKSSPIFISQSFAVKLAFAILLMAILFRTSLASPAIARARGMIDKNKIANLKMVKNIKNIDNKLKQLSHSSTKSPSK